MKKIFIILSITLIAVSCSEKTMSDKIRKTTNKYVKNKTFNGSLLIANKDSIIFQRSFGYADIDKKDTITPNTIFPIASLTKQFTATAILILQQNGKLSINDKISNYIDVPLCMKTITIKNLLNHTSGIPDYLWNNVEKTTTAILGFVAHTDELEFNPNTQHFYCNTGYFILGKIIENVSGQNYGEFLKEQIFKTIGMKQTFLYDGKKYHRAFGYDLTWGKMIF